MLYSSLLRWSRGAVIPVSQGSDGGHCCAPRAHRAPPDFIPTNGVCEGGIPGVGGIRIPGLAPVQVSRSESAGGVFMCLKEWQKSVAGGILASASCD